MGEVLLQVWLKSIDKQRECIKREFEKTSRVHASFRKPMCDENERKYRNKEKLTRF